MISYHHNITFTFTETTLLKMATKAVEYMPDPATRCKPWRCHEVARALQRILGVGRVVDGLYGGCDHSWIELPRDLFDKPTILEAYAAGRLPQVQLVDLFYGLPHAKAYKAGKARLDIRKKVVAHLVATVQANKMWCQAKQGYKALLGLPRKSKNKRKCSSCQATMLPDGTCPKAPHPTKPHQTRISLGSKARQQEREACRIGLGRAASSEGAAKAQSQSIYANGKP